MRVREFAAVKMGEALEAKVRLGQPVTILDAPPSQTAEYPALAILIERAVLDTTMAAPILQTPEGVFMEGVSDPCTGQITDGEVFIQGGVWLASMGTIQCSGRIWAGARYVSKREELEESVWQAFLQDSSAPGRLLLDLSGYTVGGITVPFGAGAAFLKQSTWSGEYSFEARLWSWTMFDLDLPLLVPQTAPLASQLILEFSRRPDISVAEPSDKANLPDLEKYLISPDGTYTPTIL